MTHKKTRRLVAKHLRDAINSTNKTWEALDHIRDLATGAFTSGQLVEMVDSLCSEEIDHPHSEIVGAYFEDAVDMLFREPKRRRPGARSQRNLLRDRSGR
jgi:hypothetical protein